MRARTIPKLGAALVAGSVVLLACDGNPVVEGEPNMSGRWIYHASEMQGTEVTCETTDVVLNLVGLPASLRLDSQFDGAAFSFRLECRQGDRTATILYTEGTDVLNGEVLDGVVGFDFGFPDFIHTGTVEGDIMSGTVATRLDLSQTPLAQVGVVNLVGEWVAVRD